jgi:hypothetical protein
MKYIEIKEEYQKKLGELSEQVGLFWAFSREQFVEGKTKNPTNGKYTSIGMGGYLPSEKVEEYLKGLKTLNKWYNEARKQSKKSEAILYELNNYECFYTGDITDAYEVLKDLYTRKEVEEVYRNYKAKKYIKK